MMKMALRIAALFVAYGSIGLGGDYAVGLLARDAGGAEPLHEVEMEIVDGPRVVVDVQPAIVSRVQVHHSGECSYQLDRELTIPADGVRELAIRAGSGELHVEGRAGLEEIVVLGMVCASHEEYVDELDLSVERALSGDLTLVTHYPRSRSRDGRNNMARIDLTVLVPMNMNVDIDDSSGEIRVLGTGDLRIEDTSGSIDVSDVNGSLRIDDSSGDLDVSRVAGDVEIDDGSGSLEVRGVAGSVILRDGSGSIELSDIDQSVLIEADGSGGIDVAGVGGDFTVDRDGSGGIRHTGVEGRVEVPSRRRRGN